MRTTEVLYRRCNQREAGLSIEHRGLVSGRYSGHRIHGIPHSSCSHKNVFVSRRLASQYSPKGVSPEDYRYCVLLEMAPGTIDALKQEKDGPNGLVRKSHHGAIGLCPGLIPWFNKRIVKLSVLDLFEQELPFHEQEYKGTNVLRASSGSLAFFIAVSCSLLNVNEQTLKLSDMFSRLRMTWLKTSLLWTLWRSGVATKQGQERIIMINSPEWFSSELVSNAVSTKAPKSRDSAVVFQKDPDRRIIGRRLAEGSAFFVRGGSTVQFGIRGEMLNKFAESVFPGHSKDITEICKSVLDSKPGHPTAALYNALGLKEISIDI